MINECLEQQEGNLVQGTGDPYADCGPPERPIHIQAADDSVVPSMTECRLDGYSA